MGEYTEFNRLVEEYMQCDKKTLAELLALKKLQEERNSGVNMPFNQPCPSIPLPWEFPGIEPYPWQRVWYTTCTQDDKNVN